ncbi:MAG: hypothetical protein ACE1ZC_02185 [Nitrososphaerales archaeon]
MAEKLNTERVAKYFIYLALANAVAAAIFTTPLLVPTFGLPLIVGVFPGTWMIIAYLSFLTVGVLGMLGWSLVYFLSSRLMGKDQTIKFLAISHLVIVELSVYGFAFTMSAAGWIGGQALRQGLSVAAVGFLIEPLVLPTGAFVALVLVGQSVGVFNMFWTLRSPRPSVS